MYSSIQLTFIRKSDDDPVLRGDDTVENSKQSPNTATTKRNEHKQNKNKHKNVKNSPQPTVGFVGSAFSWFFDLTLYAFHRFDYVF